MIRATSVTVSGEADGWVPPVGCASEADPAGSTRLVVSVPVERLQATHEALLAVLRPPLGVLWRQAVDRLNPGPQGTPPADHVALDRSLERVLAATRACAPLVYGDARAELWIRGGLGEQIVLDQDGVLYAYPDDPAFRDALSALGIPEVELTTFAQRDYVKHWYHAENDALVPRLVSLLQLTHIPHRKG